MVKFFVYTEYAGVQYLGSLLLDTLKLHSKRWETLDLTLPLAHFADKFHVLSDVKNLQQLCLTPNVKRVHPQLELFGRAVAPTYLVPSGFPFLLGVCNITWDNMTYITLRSMAPEQCLEAPRDRKKRPTFWRPFDYGQFPHATTATTGSLEGFKTPYHSFTGVRRRSEAIRIILR